MIAFCDWPPQNRTNVFIGTDRTCRTRHRDEDEIEIESGAKKRRQKVSRVEDRKVISFVRPLQSLPLPLSFILIFILILILILVFGLILR